MHAVAFSAIDSILPIPFARYLFPLALVAAYAALGRLLWRGGERWIDPEALGLWNRALLCWLLTIGGLVGGTIGLHYGLRLLGDLGI